MAAGAYSPTKVSRNTVTVTLTVARAQRIPVSLRRKAYRGLLDRPHLKRHGIPLYLPQTPGNRGFLLPA